MMASVLGAVALGGCSISFPMSPLIASSDDVTGSIQASPLGDSLDVEDWRRAKAAMATALDPQGNGSTVNWDNPASGAKGAFLPVGRAYPLNERICRGFLADLDGKSGGRHVQGTACADKSGDWAIIDTKPWKKS